LVSADQSTAATGYESQIASIYWPAVASGCRSATASRRSASRSGEFAATSDWKKINAQEVTEKLCLQAVMPIQLLFVVLVVLFAQSALAQQFYKWKDQKGEWHYSDFPPSGAEHGEG